MTDKNTPYKGSYEYMRKNFDKKKRNMRENIKDLFETF